MPEARFLGHSCVLLTDGQQRIIIDPFLTGNPKAAAKAQDIKVNYVLVTHGHGDHLGDAIDIAKRNNATIIGNFELTQYCSRKGAKVHSMHIGGSYPFEFGRVKLTVAQHGGGAGENADIYTGPPVGFVIHLDGKVVFHAGDTGLFYDMRLIGEMNAIDLAFLPIGDNFTMGVVDAAKAVELLHPKTVVPMHYDTFPIIEANPNEFARRVAGAKVVILKPGESVTF